MATESAILLTPAGSGAIAVIRLTGSRVRPFLEAHFRGTPAPAKCAHGNLEANGEVVDDAVVVLSDDKQTADLNIHGGPWVVRSVLEMARLFGFATATHAADCTVSPEAFDADTQLQREMLSAVPFAQTEIALRTLLAQPQAWRTLVELNADVADGEIQNILNSRALHWLLHPPTVAIVGVPNVGKSTLANQLFGQERSITADLPGTTRDWIGEPANIDGLAVTLLDTPGVRQTDDAIERTAIEQAREPVSGADLVVVIFDASQPFEGQRELAMKFPDAIWLHNKTDRSIGWRPERADALQIIATTGEGLPALRAAIRARFDCDRLEVGRPHCWTDRQRKVLVEALRDPSRLREII